MTNNAILVVVDPPDPRGFVKDIPEPVVRLLRKMMAKDPEERCASTHELFEDVELVRMGQAPAGGEPQAGKATVLRAFKIEKARLDRMGNEVRTLEGKLRRNKRYLWASLAAAGALLAALVVVLVIIASS